VNVLGVSIGLGLEMIRGRRGGKGVNEGQRRGGKRGGHLPTTDSNVNLDTRDESD
jgi:hypothetical protein